MKSRAAAAALLLALAGCAGQTTGPGGVTRVEAPPAPRVGDQWAYRVSSGYSKEARGVERQRVVESTADRFVIEASGLRSGRWTLTTDLRWITHLLADDRLQTFSPAYPALVFPLAAGQSWQERVTGREAAASGGDTVTVQGWVRGWERVKVPAGEFDAIRIRRVTWGGNFDREYGQSEITEDLWYAPAPGRIVRHESRWQRKILFMMAWGAEPLYQRGDWLVYELLPATEPVAQR
ncbi:MAG: hypothetical protein ACREUW_19980 [Burkholderiales bacterium]